MAESLTTLIDLFSRTDFLTGLATGVIGLVVLFAVATTWHNPPVWGVVITLAVVVAISLVIGRHISVVTGITALAIGGFLVDRDPGGLARLVGWAGIAAGAVLIGLRGGLDDLTWLSWTAPVAILIAGWCLRAWSRHLPNTLIGPMVAVTAFGVWVTVPETEHARAFLGAAIPLAIATLAPTRARLSTAGAFALAGLFVWVVAIGGDARPASIIGGWGALGALAILPWVRPDAAETMKRRPLLVLGFHSVFVLMSTRLIGLWESAVVASAALLLLALLALVVAGSMTGRAQPVKVGSHGPE